MPRRDDVKSIMIIGSGPIVIGQACEFDYSGTQAVQALKEEGYKVILVNSNPATIMTDPGLADRVYIEPLSVDFVTKVIKKEKPDALLPTMGGQVALNLTMELHRQGILKKNGVEILGAQPESIVRGEDRQVFKEILKTIDVESAKSYMARNESDADQILKDLGLPLILRPSFTLGGEGGATCHTAEDFKEKLKNALFLSPTNECLVEEDLTGWKEYELEVVRDRKDNVVIVCSIENFDPMGVHTGDSITVAPAQTLTDKEYQNLRDQAIRIIRAIGVETGGSNIQFSVNPKNGRVVCIEMNPRVSRSSALASKATGFPIARVAAKLACGYTLDELQNDITKSTPCSFEPSIDYVVTKIPRFDFRKFTPTEPVLTTQMKSVGEVMAIGRTFEESLGKAMVGLETRNNSLMGFAKQELRWDLIEKPNPDRLHALADAIREGVSIAEISKRSGIDPWFLDRMAIYLEGEKTLAREKWPLSRDSMRAMKQLGWTDRAIGRYFELPEETISKSRIAQDIYPSFQMVDTCAAEFEAKTPYLYSTYRGEDESQITSKKKVMIIGGGPNRIGQGIEFDYCCVHAALALREQGYETIMVNSNPETVSTDFNVSDKLYFEPLTAEHVLNIARIEKPIGAIVQFGGQTPLKLAKALERGGLKVLGTTTESIDTAEDRERCDSLLKDLEKFGLNRPEATIARTRSEAIERANTLGYPVLVRPSYVLGGRGMRIVHSEKMLQAWIDEAIAISDDRPVLIDRFLKNATEVDVDAISDGKETFIGGILEHIEEAGIHSGDSACSLPPVTLPPRTVDTIRTLTRELSSRLKVVGLLNVQFAIHDGKVFLIEVNPRASRTVPFVSKSVGQPLAKLAAKIMCGKTLKELGITSDLDLKLEVHSVKAPVFPFDRFPKVDIILGPEMKSTGEVMGRDKTFAGAFSKAMEAARMKLPKGGHVFLSIRDEDKAPILPIAMRLRDLGFEITATKGTAEFLNRYDLNVNRINKVVEGTPHCVGAIQEGRFSLVINTTSDERAVHDSFSVRRATLENKIPYSTVVSSARAMVQAIEQAREQDLGVDPL